MIFIMLVVCQSCKKENRLQSNKTFDETETKEIIELLNKFDNEICSIENQAGNEISNCYQSFFERIWKEVETGNYDIGINEENHKEIIETLSPRLIKEFWREGQGVINRRIPNSKSRKTFPDTIQSIYITQGKYFEFLKNEVAEIDSKTEWYFERFNQVMDISPSLFADVAKNYELYNIEDDRVRLLIAIHYLTLNKQNLEYKASYDRLYKEIDEEFEKRKEK